jgi:hypothetical protein
VRRHFNPDERPVRATQPKQVIGDRGVSSQPIEELLARLLIDESLDLERTNLGGRRIGGVSEHQFQIRIRGDRLRALQIDDADVDAFVNGLEQARERFSGSGVGSHDGTDAYPNTDDSRFLPVALQLSLRASRAAARDEA